jgi:hypothetical protein
MIATPMAAIKSPKHVCAQRFSACIMAAGSSGGLWVLACPCATRFILFACCFSAASVVDLAPYHHHAKINEPKRNANPIDGPREMTQQSVQR